MNKAYNKITWQNKPSTATPLNQTNLNEMSNALDTIDDRVIALDSGKVSSVTVTNTLPTGDTIATINVDGTATNIKSAQITVDNAISPTSTNPVQNKVIYEALQSVMPEVTVEGNPISITDGSDLVGAKQSEVTFLPKQDLHGYDNPWVGGSGKNKIPLTVAGIKSVNSGTWSDNSFTKNGVTFAILTDDAENVVGIKVNGTASANADLYLFGSYGSTTALIASGEYKATLTGITVDTELHSGYGSGGFNTVTNSNPERTLNATNGVSYCMIRVKSGASISTAITVKPMIRLSSVTDATFEPYSNICPISGWTELNLTRTGKNISSVNSANGIAWAISNADLKTVFNNLKNGTYTISFDIEVKTVTSTGDWVYGFLAQNPNGNVQKMVNVSTSATVGYKGSTTYTFTISDTNRGKFNSVNLYGCGSWQQGAKGTSDFSKIQIELGSQATTYEAYQGQTYTETLGATYYGGKVDFVSGELTNEYERVNLGSLSWVKAGSGASERFQASLTNPLLPSANNVPFEGVSECYPSAPWSYFDSAGHDYFMALNSSANLFAIRNTSYSDADTFKNSVNDLYLCYKKATPTTLATTQTQIDLLKGNNVISSDGNSIKLVYSADIGLYIAGQLNS